MITRSTRSTGRNIVPSEMNIASEINSGSKKPVKTNTPMALYANTDTNEVIFAEVGQAQKSIIDGTEFISSLNFIDQIITKINDTSKHAEKIKLLGRINMIAAKKATKIVEYIGV